MLLLMSSMNVDERVKTGAWRESGLLRHTSHVTRHTSHVTRHTSHATHFALLRPPDVNMTGPVHNMKRAKPCTNVTRMQHKRNRACMQHVT
jgi:hypothetical protein